MFLDIGFCIDRGFRPAHFERWFAIRLDNFSVILILVKVFAISNSTCSSVGTHFYAAREINQSSLRVAIEFDGGFAQVILLAELTNTLDIAFVDILLVDIKALEVVTVGKEIHTANIEVFDPSGHTALRQEKNGKRRTKTTKRYQVLKIVKNPSLAVKENLLKVDAVYRPALRQSRIILEDDMLILKEPIGTSEPSYVKLRLVPESL